MASEYDTDSKRVVSGTGYARIPGYRNLQSRKVNPGIFKLVLDEDKQLDAVSSRALTPPGGEIHCYCLALGYSKEQCKSKECNCDWCRPLATWFFCEELVIQEEPG